MGLSAPGSGNEGDAQGSPNLEGPVYGIQETAICRDFVTVLYFVMALLCHWCDCGSLFPSVVCAGVFTPLCSLLLLTMDTPSKHYKTNDGATPQPKDYFEGVDLEGVEDKSIAKSAVKDSRDGAVMPFE